LSLLRWTAQDTRKADDENAEAAVETVLDGLGMDGDIWRDLVWNFKRYFGKSSCAGGGEAMADHARRHGKSWCRGQRHLRSTRSTSRVGKQN
jgi:hypothetical protein